MTVVSETISKPLKTKRFPVRLRPASEQISAHHTDPDNRFVIQRYCVFFARAPCQKALMIRCAIVVPSHNRPGQLASCLDALVRQDIKDYEIIVVDDGSAPPLNDVCLKYGDRVCCVRQQNAGPAAARNRGTTEATAELLRSPMTIAGPGPAGCAGCVTYMLAGETAWSVGGSRMDCR